MRKNNITHYVHPTGLAFGITAGIVYSLCTLAVTLWSTQAVRLFSYWFHGIDLMQIAVTPQITFWNFLTGLFGVVIFAYLVGVLYAWIYTKCVDHCERRGWI